MPKSVAVTGAIFCKLLLMRTKPKRKSFTTAGENRWVSSILRNRALIGRSYGKSRSVALMLLARVAPREACNPPAPNGKNDSEFEKKKRAESLSLPPRNSRSQVVVNWSSVYLPGLLTMKGEESPR